MLLFSEDDAQHPLEMPMYKMLIAVDYAAASGRSVDECPQILADMGDRGLITVRVRAGVPYYELMTMEPGIWEHNIFRIENPEYVNAHHNSVGTDMNVDFNETPVSSSWSSPARLTSSRAIQCPAPRGRMPSARSGASASSPAHAARQPTP